MATKKYDLFISYADADSQWVAGYLLDALQEAEVNYCSEETFTLGAVRLDEFERAIRESERTLLVLSQAYLADPENKFINSLSQNFGLETSTWPVIPLRLEQNLKVPTKLQQLVGLDATTPEKWEKEINRLCKDLDVALPKEVNIPECPYPGMLPFSEDDSERFFGRSQEIEGLLGRLRSSSFLTVIGPSGSGKSSLVLAGLIPTLHKSKLLGSGKWAVRIMRPGATPMSTLKTWLNDDLTEPTPAITNLLKTHSAERLLLVIDQFEELFTIASQQIPDSKAQEVIPFQETLLHLIQAPNCYVILTVRADFYPDLMGCLLWQKIKTNRFEVEPLNETGLREAIVRPAEDVGVFIETTLVDRLLADSVGEPGILPFVQETLVWLWQRIERRFLPLRAYESLILLLPRNVYGHKQTGLEVAIVWKADAALGDLESDQQVTIARRIFLRLIQFGEGRKDTRRQQPVSDLRVVNEDSAFDHILDHLATRRLLTLSGEEGEEKKVDIAHEALITGWPNLQQWIIERQEAEQTRRRLVAKAKDWVRLGRGNGGLLDLVELAEAEHWLTSLDVLDLGYDESLQALVTTSREAIEQLERDKQQRQQQELQLARKITRLAIAAAGFASMALFTVGFAFLQQRQSQKTIEAVFLGSDTTEILNALPELHQKANNYRNSVDRFKDIEDLAEATTYYQTHKAEINRVFAYYRNILTQTSRLRAGDLESTSAKLVEEIANEAEQSLAEMLGKYRIPKLKLQLNQQSQPNLGQLLPETQRTDFEKQYSEGALWTTYEILMGDSGAGADLNGDGYVADQIEANLMPCDILREIERLWRQATDERFGWYGEEGQYEDADCRELDPDRNTLYVSIFEYPTGNFDPIMRIEYCGISPKIRFNHH
ncbi:MAG: TIR domain-containing protein [Symploca sp. SIO2C1]|nr:TIR domain-containing protein [Symploca sp. SIO2C1]